MLMHREIDSFREGLGEDVEEERGVRGQQTGHLDISLVQVKIVGILGNRSAQLIRIYLKACARSGPTRGRKK